MLGSHIDSVIDAGIYDGSYGVLSGLETIQSLKENNIKTKRPVTVAAFTNEEGVRFPPSMLGSLVYSGDLSLEKALDTMSIDGLRLGDELERIGYAGNNEPGLFSRKPILNCILNRGRYSIRKISKLVQFTTFKGTQDGKLLLEEKRTMQDQHRTICVKTQCRQ